MKSPATQFRRYAPLGVALALTAGILLLGLHHHEGSGIDRGCVLCLLSHAPVLPSAWVGAQAAILLPLWRIVGSPVRFHREYTGSDLALRAPPRF